MTVPSQASPTQKKPRAPIQARAAETRARILEEAYSAFAERGFDGANTRDIASAAGASHAVIRYHFGTKDQLWRATVEAMFQRMHEELAVDEREMKVRSPTERLRDFLARYIRYCAGHTNHARIVIGESMRGGERLEWMTDAFVRTGHETVRREIDALVHSGDLPRSSSITLLYLIVSMCQLPFVLAKEAESLYGVDFLSADAIEDQIDAVMALLVRR